MADYKKTIEEMLSGLPTDEQTCGRLGNSIFQFAEQMEMSDELLINGLTQFLAYLIADTDYPSEVFAQMQTVMARHIRENLDEDTDTQCSTDLDVSSQNTATTETMQ